jgi:hypothetical protein
MSGEIIVELSQHNMMMAGLVGVTRHIKGMFKIGTYGIDNSTKGWQANCDGACGEMCVSMTYDKYWDGAIGNFEAKDAGEYQVRSTTYPNGSLILHPRDKDEDVFILVLTHKSPRFILKGWMYAKEGKLEKHWDKDKPNPAFFVKQKYLHDMSSIPSTDTRLLKVMVPQSHHTVQEYSTLEQSSPPRSKQP